MTSCRPGPCRRPALPRRLADAVRAGQARPDRATRVPPERDVRRRGALRPLRGNPPGAGAAHAIRATIEEAEAAREAGEERVILLGLSGHGHFDMSAYQAYLAGELEDPGVLGGRHAGRARPPAGRPGDRLS